MANITGHSIRRVRPLHPPFTHFPIAAYVMAAGFDVISAIGGGHAWAGQFWHAGTFVLIAGLSICLVTMLTGFADLARFAERRAAAVRTMAVHVCVQAGAFVIGVVDVTLGIAGYDHPSSTPVALLLTIAAAICACVGGFFGGTLVYTYGHGVAVEPERKSATAASAGHRSVRPARPARGADIKPVTRHRIRGR